MADDRFILRMRGITKKFGDVSANDDVDFDLRAGEIHALLGENGAGKSTLMNILSGLYQADAGVIEIDGVPVSITSPRDALAAGIGMVHQHFMLIWGRTVAENIILGLPEPRFILKTAAINRKIESLAENYHLSVDPAARIWQLSIGERQRVEILKLLYRKTRVLILDEPTSVLAPQEIAGLFTTLRRIAKDGGAIIFISHKLEEVMAISDRITVLRGGKNVATTSAAEVTAGDLAQMMVGELTVPLVREETVKLGQKAENVLSLEGIWARNDRGMIILKDINLKIKKGEIFGLLGVAGNGQRELVEVVTGLRKADRGTVSIGGKDLGGAGPRRFIEEGVTHIPEDRLGMGLVSSMSLAENLLLKSYRQKEYSGTLLLKKAAMDDAAGDLVRRFGILPGDISQRAGTLSGGNIQRLILARELVGDPSLLVAAYPFQGLDIAATDFLIRTLKKKAGGGLAVLLIGEDLELTLSISHRVGVLYEGVLHGVMPTSEVNTRELALLMTGQKPEGALR